MKKPLISSSKAQALVRRYGAPLYVYRKSVVEGQYRKLAQGISYPRKRIFYACKANSNVVILRLLKRLGASIECVSPGEVARAREVGFPALRIAYTCSYMTRKELAWIIRQGVEVHIDSLNQLLWWGQLKPGSEVSVRINRGFGAGATSHIITGGPESKFGIYFTDIPEILDIAARYKLTIVGIQQHIGSSILEPKAFLKAMGLLFDAAGHFPDLRYIDFGGGFGIPYHPQQKSLDVKKLGRDMSAVFSAFCKRYGRSLELRIQPGRFIVAEAGALLVQVADIKRTPGHTFVGVDSGFNHLIRPAFYGSYHHLFNLSNPSGRQQRVDVVGNICESSDKFAEKRYVPQPRIGDLLLCADAGAYGFVMSSDYNLRPKPKEIFID